MIAPSLQRTQILRSDLAGDDISHAIFDFDGTLSWLRHGWPTLMLNTFLEHAPPSWGHDEQLRSGLLADILSLNGKPSIHQFARCCERATFAGVKVPAPEELLAQYLPAIRSAVTGRIASIRSGECSPDEFLVWNVRCALKNLRAHDVTLIILSGTAEDDVREEATVLGLTDFFGDHIYGSRPDSSFSKKDVIDRIMREQVIEGRHLIAFGDGPVEIGFTKAVGGLAIGVASDEEVNGSHRLDSAKREQLVMAGADAIIPDYEEIDALLAIIFKP